MLAKKKKNLTVWRNLYPDHFEIKDTKTKFYVGNKVRISKKKKNFDKGYTTRWTAEIFTITEVKRTSPVTCKIADLMEKKYGVPFTNPNCKRLVKSCIG